MQGIVTRKLEENSRCFEEMRHAIFGYSHSNKAQNEKKKRTPNIKSQKCKGSKEVSINNSMPTNWVT